MSATCVESIGEVLPAAIAEQLRRFLVEGRTGKITLDVQDGRIRQARAEVVWPAAERGRDTQFEGHI